MKTDVLIIGAGPTGLMAAAQLARFGVDFIILDKKSGPTIESRAIGVTPRSLEIYQQMGLSEEVLQEGTPINEFHAWNDGRKKAEIKIAASGTGFTDFNFLFAFEQSKNESMLASFIVKKGGEILWNTVFDRLEQHKEGVNILADREGSKLSISAKYLIACDGAGSPVRQQLDVPFEGGTYENRFFVADTALAWDLGYDKLIVSPANRSFCAFFPMKGEKAYRVVGTLPKQFFDKEEVAFSDIEEVVKQNIGVPLNFNKLNWFSVYKLHHRCVNSFRKGRIFLAGDSAHIHSPAGAQGMNTGLQDAYNLAWKLALVLKNQAAESILDTYNKERLPFAKWLLRFTDRAFGIMTNEHPVVAFFRKNVMLNMMGLVLKNAKFRLRMFRTVSQLHYNYRGKGLDKNLSKQRLGFMGGDRLPFIEEAYYLHFTDPCFHLLHLYDTAQAKELETSSTETFPFLFPCKLIRQPINQAWHALGVNRELFVLIRPDLYIACIQDHDDFSEYAKLYC